MIERMDYCPDCQKTGVAHCAHPDECGGMKPNPFDEANAIFKKAKWLLVAQCVLTVVAMSLLFSGSLETLRGKLLLLSSFSLLAVVMFLSRRIGRYDARLDAIRNEIRHNNDDLNELLRKATKKAQS